MPTAYRNFSVAHLLFVEIIPYIDNMTEVKVKPQHTDGAEHANVEPITPEVVAKMEKPMVDVTSSSTCQGSSNEKQK